MELRGNAFRDNGYTQQNKTESILRYVGVTPDPSRNKKKRDQLLYSSFLEDRTILSCCGILFYDVLDLFML